MYSTRDPTRVCSGKSSKAWLRALNRLLTHAERRSRERLVAIVLSGDRGLCGAFNTNIMRATERFFVEHRNVQMELIVVGRKARDYFRRRSQPIRREMVQVFRTSISRTPKSSLPMSRPPTQIRKPTAWC